MSSTLHAPRLKYPKALFVMRTKNISVLGIVLLLFLAPFRVEADVCNVKPSRGAAIFGSPCKCPPGTSKTRLDSMSSVCREPGWPTETKPESNGSRSKPRKDDQFTFLVRGLRHFKAKEYSPAIDQFDLCRAENKKCQALWDASMGMYFLERARTADAKANSERAIRRLGAALDSGRLEEQEALIRESLAEAKKRMAKKPSNAVSQNRGTSTEDPEVRTGDLNLCLEVEHRIVGRLLLEYEILNRNCPAIEFDYTNCESTTKCETKTATSSKAVSFEGVNYGRHHPQPRNARLAKSR